MGVDRLKLSNVWEKLAGSIESLANSRWEKQEKLELRRSMLYYSCLLTSCNPEQVPENGGVNRAQTDPTKTHIAFDDLHRREN